MYFILGRRKNSFYYLRMFVKLSNAKVYIDQHEFDYDEILITKEIK